MLPSLNVFSCGMPLETGRLSFTKSSVAGWVFLLVNVLFASAIQGQITQVTGSPQTSTTTNTTLTITKPSGLAVGDVMFANIVQTNNDGGGAALSDASSTGWTVIAGNLIGSSGNDDWWGTLLYKVATASDVAAADFDFTLDNDANGDGSSGAIIAFSGVDVTGGVTESGAAGGPFDVDPGNVYTNLANDNSLNASAITTSTANAAVIMYGIIGNDIGLSNWATTNPSVLTEIYDLPFNTILDNGSGAAWATKTTAGSTGNGSATIGGNTFNGAILINGS